MRHLLAALILLAGYGFAVGADLPPGSEPVPATNINGMRMNVPGAGCSLEAPGPTWRWLLPAGGAKGNYLCFNTVSGGSVPISIGELKGAFDEHTRQEILNAATKSANAQKITVANAQYAAASMPLPGSTWRLTYECSNPAGQKLVAIYYFIVPMEKKLVTIQGYSPDGNDPPMFRKIVSSLKLEKAG